MTLRDRWPDRPPYLAGLLLAGRPVVVVGGGALAARRLPALLRAGASVTVVAPEVVATLQRAALRGELRWVSREFRTDDLADAWYVLAATDRPEVNQAVADAAEVQRTFCVRADRGDLGTAFTPATGVVDDAVVAVLTPGGPRRAAALRDRLLRALSAVLGRDAA